MKRISVNRKVFDQGVIAQLVERLNGIEEVWGSNPHGSKDESSVVKRQAYPIGRFCL